MKHPPPQHLDEQARVKWAELLPVLDGRGDLDGGTLDALSCYCVAWSRWTAAEQQVNALGTVVKSPAGFPVANPYVAIAAAAQRQMRQWASVLGLHNRPSRRKASQSGDAAPADPKRAEGAGLLRLLGDGNGKTTKPRGRKRPANVFSDQQKGR